MDAMCKMLDKKQIVPVLLLVTKSQLKHLILYGGEGQGFCEARCDVLLLNDMNTT